MVTIKKGGRLNIYCSKVYHRSIKINSSVRKLFKIAKRSSEMVVSYVLELRKAMGKTRFNCIIRNIKLIQHRFIKSLVLQFGRNSHSEKNKVSIEPRKQTLRLGNH